MTIRVANSPLSWGIHSDTADPMPYDELLDMMKQAGFEGTTLGPWGYYPTAPDTLRDALDARGLALVSTSLRLNLSDSAAYEAYSPHLLEVTRLLAAVGAETLILIDSVPPESRPAQEAGRVRSPRLSADEWDDFAAVVSRIANVVRSESGLRTAFRHSAGSHVETGDEVERLMDRLDPELVGLCLDTGHWRFAGGDVMEAIRAYDERIWQLYLSDSDPDIRQFAIDEQLTFYEATQAGVFCQLGTGDVDLAGVVRWLLRRSAFDGWLVLEQDTLSDDPAEHLVTAHANREFLRALGV